MDTTQNTTPIDAAPVSAPAPVSGEHKKVGPIVAISVIVLVLIAAAIYLFASQMNKEGASTSDTTLSQENDLSASVTAVTSKSDDVNDLEADLNTSINGIDNQNF